MTSRTIVMLAALALASPATAQGSVSAQRPDVDVSNSNMDRVVCKSELRTGTRFKERNCKTVREWEIIREQHRRTAAEMVDRPVICGGGGSREGC